MEAEQDIPSDTYFSTKKTIKQMLTVNRTATE